MASIPAAGRIGPPPALGPLPRNGSLERLVFQRFGPRAQQAIKILHAQPGLNIDELAAAMGIRRTAANHHVRVLQRAGIVVRVRQARHQLHFAGDTTPLEREVLCLLRVPSVHEVARALFEGQPLENRALAGHLNVTGRTVRRAVRQLSQHNLLRIDDAAGQPIAHLHPLLRILLARIPAGEADAP